MRSHERAATLPVRFFARPAEVVARELLGKLIQAQDTTGILLGRIVETEAYLGVIDPASHAWQGRRHAQNESLYGPPGQWYVYRSYGVHWCANLVCKGAAPGAAVLLRAVEPLEGVERMAARRGAVAPRLLASGPGRLTEALGISRALDGQSMPQSPVRILESDEPEGLVLTGRIGITRAADWPLRFVVAGTRWASRPVTTTLRAPSRG